MGMFSLDDYDSSTFDDGVKYVDELRQNLKQQSIKFNAITQIYYDFLTHQNLHEEFDNFRDKYGK